MELIGRTEEIILLAIWRLQGDAYGISIRDELKRRTDRDWSLGAIYSPLHRLERKGLVRTRRGASEARRGGRGTVLYRLTDTGKRSLLDVKAVQDALWVGIAKLQVA